MVRSAFRSAKKNSPSIVWHFYVVEVRPTVSANVDGGAEIDVIRLETFGAELVPPVQIARLPVFKSSLKSTIVSDIYIIWNFLGIVDTHLTLFSNQNLASSLSRIVSMHRFHRLR